MSICHYIDGQASQYCSMTDAFLQLHVDPLGTISLYDGVALIWHRGSGPGTPRRQWKELSKKRIARGQGLPMAAGFTEDARREYPQARLFHSSEIQ